MPTPFHISPRQNLSRKSLPRRRLFRSKRSNLRNKLICIVILAVMCIIIFQIVQGPATEHEETQSITQTNNTKIGSEKSDTTTSIADPPQQGVDKCSFRTYKPNRYYPVKDISEPFLSNAEYIRGQLPFVINPRSDGVHSDSMPKKLCIDTSGWEKDIDADHRPFSGKFKCMTDSVYLNL